MVKDGKTSPNNVCKKNTYIRMVVCNALLSSLSDTHISDRPLIAFAHYYGTLLAIPGLHDLKITPKKIAVFATQPFSKASTHRVSG